MSSSPAERPPRRAASLFAQLLRVQLGLAIGLGLVIWALFYVERNVTVATLYAEQWAPQLRAAAGLDDPPAVAPAPAPAPAAAVLRRAAPPPLARRVSALAPRFIALRRALWAQGLAVEELRIEFARRDPQVWLRVAGRDGVQLWLGIAGQVVVPEWSGRVLLALSLVAALVLGLSWWAARRLAAPLERLRARIERQQPGAPYPPLPAVDDVPPEVAAIDAAYADLLSRWQRQQRERSLLLVGVSHDLRSPLGRIRMAAELLPDTAENERRKVIIVRNVGEMDRLVESFVDFVRSGELPCDTTVDLAAAARAVVAGFDRTEEQLSLTAPASLQIHDANALLLERLIANLVDNALKHGRPPVRVSVSTAPPSLTVADAGDGLAPHQLEALQEAFQRGDSARTQAGSGLGLAIVRQVAARLGARLAFERDAQGQRVSVVWPQRAS